MKHLLLLVCTFFLVVSAKSQDNYLHQYKWKNRVLLVFAENQQDEDYQAQLALFDSEQEGFEERRKKFAGNKGFSLVLIGKDGSVKLKHSHLTTAIEVYSRIDNMPMRKKEIEEKSGSQ